MPRQIVFLAMLSILVPMTIQFRFLVEREDKNGEIRREFQLDRHLRCIPLRNCTVFMWILKNSRKLKSISSSQLFQIAENKMCDVDELSLNTKLTLDSKVACPEVADDSDEPEYNLQERVDYDDQNYLNYVEDYEYLTENEKDGELLNERNIHDLVSEKSNNGTCIGSLELYHGPNNHILNDIQILKLSNKWKEIGNLKKLEERRVLRIKAFGNCCWKIYRREHFQGRYERIFTGYDKHPRIQLKSMKKVDC